MVKAWSRRRWSTWLAALASAGPLLAACAAGAAPDGTAPAVSAAATGAPTSIGPVSSPMASRGTPAAAGPTAAAPSEAPEALRFEGSTVDGASFAGASLAGKPVVLWFWAPWCTICRGEAPDVARLEAQYAGKVQFVGVAGRGSVEEMRAFVSDTGTGGFVHLADADGSLWARFGIPAQPSFVLISRSGDAQRVIGAIPPDELPGVLDQLVAA